MEQMITSSDAAKKLGMSYQGFFRLWIKSGKIKSAELKQVGGLKLWFVDEKEIDELKEERANQEKER